MMRTVKHLIFAQLPCCEKVYVSLLKVFIDKNCINIPSHWMQTTKVKSDCVAVERSRENLPLQRGAPGLSDKHRLGTVWLTTLIQVHQLGH